MGNESDHTRLDLDVIKGMGTGLAHVKKAFDGLDKLNTNIRMILVRAVSPTSSLTSQETGNSAGRS